MYTFSDESLSSLHEEARGSKPSDRFLAMWKNLKDTQKQEIWSSLLEEVQTRDITQIEKEQKALDDLKSGLKTIMRLMTCDWKTALQVMSRSYGYYNIDDVEAFEEFLFAKGLQHTPKFQEIKEKYYKKSA